MNAKKWLTIGALTGAAALGLTREAQADRRDFPFTYGWKQPHKGERELELKSRYRGRNNSFRQEIELEIGITNRFMIAPYVEFEKTSGTNLKYNAFKLESRYQLGDYKTKSILPGLYLEYEKERGGPSALEGKLILSRYSKRGDNLSFNYIVERELTNGAEFENEYSFGYARDFGKSGARIGGEWIHDLSSGRINAGPTIAFAPIDSVWLVGGYAFAVNDRGGNRGEFRLNLGYEF